MGKVRRNEIVLPAKDLGTDAFSEVMGSLSVPYRPEINIAEERMTTPTQFKQRSDTDISDLSNKQLNNFYLSNSEEESQLKNELFADEQGSIAKWGNGLTKFLSKTGTAVIGGTLGTIYGIGSGIVNGEFNKLYDNDFNKSLDSWDEYMDENFKNYISKEASEKEWYEQMMPFSGASTKFWADDVLGVLSFTVGAVLSETLWSAATAATLGGAGTGLAANTVRLTAKAGQLLKNTGKAENLYDAGRFTRQLITGAGYEAGVEARHTKKEILDKMKSDYVTETGNQIDEKSPEYAQMLDRANAASNSVFVANMAVLSLSNAITLPKTFGQLNKTFGQAVESVENKFFNPIIKSGDNFKAKWDDYSNLRKGLVKAKDIVKNPVWEGFIEEGTQGSISEAAKLYVSKKYDPKGHENAYSVYEALGEGFEKTYGSAEGWKEIGIGMIIGGMGVPMISKNESGNLSLSIQGGVKGALNQANEERKETQELVKLMNSKKALHSTKALWQNAVSNSSKKQIDDNDIFEQKNEQAEEFFTFVNSRYKGGYFSAIKEELADEIEKMKPSDFADAFGYSNMTEQELNERKKDVVKKVVNRADQIKTAIEQAKKITSNGNEDLTDGIAYTLSTISNIDEREKEISKEIESKLGVTGQDLKLYNQLKKQEQVHKKELQKAQSIVNKINKTKEKEGIQDADKNLKIEFDKLQEIQKELKKQDLLKNEIYEGDVIDFVNKLNQNQLVKDKLLNIESVERDNVQEKISDLEKLQNKKKQFIESYNNLRTKEGREEFVKDVEDFKSYLFSEIPEGFTKRSATLAYYQQQGERFRRNLGDKSKDPEQNDVQGKRMAQNQPFEPVFEPIGQPNIPVAPVVNVEDEEGTFSSPFAPVTIEEVSQTNTETEDSLTNDIVDLLGSLDGDKMLVQGDDKAYTDEQLDKFSSDMKLVLRKLDALLVKTNPELNPKERLQRILKKVTDSANLTEQKFNLLVYQLNINVARGKTEFEFKPSASEWYKTDIEVPTSDLTDSQVSAKTQIEPIEYGHDKNLSPSNSLAYLSHEYIESNGRIESTGKLAQNENNQALLVSNEAFNVPNKINATIRFDRNQPFNKLKLDFDVKIELEENSQKVVTSLHLPQWILEIKDKAGKRINNDSELDILIELALQNKKSEIVNTLNRMVDGKVTMFRNVYGSNEHIANEFIKNVKLRKQILDSGVDNLKADIISISPGKVSTKKDYTDNTLPDYIEYAIVGQNGELMIDSQNNHPSQSKNMVLSEFLNKNKGTIAALIPSRNGEGVLPMLLKHKKVTGNSDEQFLFYYFLLENLVGGKEYNINGQRLNSKDSKDLKKLLSIYSIHLTNLSNINLETKADYVFIDTLSDGGFRIVAPNIIYKDGNLAPSLRIKSVADFEKPLSQIVAEQGLKIRDENVSNGEFKITSDMKVKDLVWNYSLGKSMLIESSNNLLRPNSKLPKLTVNAQSKRIIEAITIGQEISGKEHLKIRTMTNINSDIKDPLNENKTVLWEQPIYTFELNADFKPEVVESVVQQETVQKKEVNTIEPKDFNTGQVFDNNDLFDDYLSTEFSNSVKNSINLQTGNC